RGAGEIVLNCMNQDGVRRGYDIEQLALVRDAVQVPLIASGGAGALEHFKDVFERARVDGALAASVFHSAAIAIPDLKRYLLSAGIPVRPPAQDAADGSSISADARPGGSGSASGPTPVQRA